ncbi:hypothetical protein HPP92_001834 [Vanilla planifolia]|uniref:Uncharacterized protein n=1 Tax=Vanilla planifolia TaxID=51239 RepID=A0A835SCN6_VANPL|nr:hypothetical protein HPP92_001834 [Vanilla planifolia]
MVAIMPMAAEMVKSATSEKLKDMDWSKNIEICEIVAKDPGKAKEVVKCIKKRLGHKNANTQLFAVRLLEMLMNNCGEYIHRQVIDNGLLPMLVKIVKKKTDLPVRERIFLLLDATQTSLGGAKGKFPQYYAAYYDLVVSRVQFPQHRRIQSCQISQEKEKKEHLKKFPELSEFQKYNDVAIQPSFDGIIEHSIIQKASSVMVVLKEVLNALAPKCPEEAADEFILDLIEQCSFQKQQIMHLIMTCHDEKVISRAIEVNEQLEQLLAHHDSLVSVRALSNSNVLANEEAEDDEERLFRRISKGKARAEDDSDFMGGSLRTIPDEELRHRLVRPLSIQTSDRDGRQHPPHPPVVSIPPPPSKHLERERFFKEKHMDGSALDDHMRGLSIHSRHGSSSRSGSTDFSDTWPS